MKKSDLAEGIVFVVIGIACLFGRLFTEARLGGLVGYCLVVGVRRIRDYLYWNKPENRERGQEILENERIEMQDELKVKVRDKAGRYAYLFGIYTVCAAIAVFAVLEAVGVMDDVRGIVLCLGGYLVAQVIAERVIFNHIFKKY